MARRNKSAERDLAAQRIRRLITLAQAHVRKEGATPESKRYVALARRIGMRYQVSLPRDVRRLVCRECGALLVTGATARHRITNGRVTITCLACGAVKRYPFRPLRKVSP